MSDTATRQSLPSIPALAAVDYTAKDQFAVPDVTGEPVARLSMVPSVFVSRAMSALRKADSLPAVERSPAIRSAVEMFKDEVVADMSPTDYRIMTSRISGLPISNVDYSVESIVAAGRGVDRAVAAAAPHGVTMDWPDPGLADGGAVWIRRGDTLAIHAAGNSPGIHASWLQALALGFRIAVRPSRREPLTPYRLIIALRAAGFAPDQVMMLPTDYAAAEEILRSADLSVVYGGDDVVSKYAGDPSVLVRGPGRSKLVVTSDIDWEGHLDAIVRAVAAGGGTSCMNATAIFVEGDAGAVAEAVAERLASLPSLPPEHPDAALPVVAMSRAKELEEHFLARSNGAKVWLGKDGIADGLADGSAALRPAVAELGSASDPRVNLELPFPCVWVAPWSTSEDAASLNKSLSVTALTADRTLVAALIAEPSIANVMVGDARSEPGSEHLPHDDYFAAFLMRAKAVRSL
jgi:acyl-CoA reductase-like NAD-dependent aldehyde dehydrogenase